MCLKKKKIKSLEESTEKIRDKVKNKLQEGNYLEWAYILRKQKRNNKKEPNSGNI